MADTLTIRPTTAHDLAAVDTLLAASYPTLLKPRLRALGAGDGAAADQPGQSGAAAVGQLFHRRERRRHGPGRRRLDARRAAGRRGRARDRACPPCRHPPCASAQGVGAGDSDPRAVRRAGRGRRADDLPVHEDRRAVLHGHGLFGCGARS